MRSVLFQFRELNDYTGLFAGLGFTTNETPADNEWCFNSKKEVHVKDASASVFGALSRSFNWLQIGDIIEIKCEVYSVSGVLPKIAIDGVGGISNPGLVNTAGYTYTSGTWVPITLKYIIQKLSNSYHVLLGTFTADTGEYKIRNLSIKISTNTNINFDLTSLFPYGTGYSDVSATYKSSFRKDVNGNVTLILNCKKVDGTNFVAGVNSTLGTLPLGYRPTQAIRFSIIGDTVSAPLGGWGVGWITPSGILNIRPGTELKDVGFLINYPTQ